MGKEMVAGDMSHIQVQALIVWRRHAGLALEDKDRRKSKTTDPKSMKMMELDLRLANHSLLPNNQRRKVNAHDREDKRCIPFPFPELSSGTEGDLGLTKGFPTRTPKPEPPGPKQQHSVWHFN